MASLGRRSGEAVILIAVLIVLGWGLQRLAGVEGARVEDETPASRTDLATPGLAAGEPKQSDAPPPPNKGSAECVESAKEKLSDDERMDQFERLKQDTFRVLSGSTDAEHLFVAAAVTPRDEAAAGWQLLSQASAADPGHPLITSLMLEHCVRRNDKCDTSTKDLEDRLIRAAANNGMAWIKVAVSRVQRGEDVAALMALREAIAAPVYQNYFVELLQIFDRGLASVSDISSGKRLEFATGMAASVGTLEPRIFALCQDRAETRGEWPELCVALARRMGAHGREFILQMSGLELEKAMHDLLGNREEQRRVDGRISALRTRFDDLADVHQSLDFERDEVLLRRYVDVFATSGEILAMEFVAGEAEALNDMQADDNSEVCKDP